MVSYGSQRKIWWKCANGHEWETPVFARTGKYHGCPYCTGKRVAPGTNLKAQYPDIARQWHPTKNAQLKPEQYLPGSHTVAWWLCDKGHEWRALIKSRVKGSGCPVCANKLVADGVNDLATAFPALANQWHPARNGSLTPSQVVAKSDRRVWWHCDNGHEWIASIASRVSGSGCPICANRLIVAGENDLASFDPALAEQWCQEKNGTLMPQQVSPFSNKRVWWRCKLGHEWKAQISARSFNKSGCPYCSNKSVLAGFNDLATVEPKVAAQWHPLLNAPLEPTMVTTGSTKKVWWKCPLGHEWKAVVYSRTGARKCGCPVCAGKKPAY